MRTFVLLFAAWLGLQPAVHGGETPRHVAGQVTYALVVNDKNPASTKGDTTKGLVKDLFLKNLGQWPGGLEAKPYAREATSAEMTAFGKQVLGMSEAEIARHWLRLKNSNGNTPPRAVDSDRLMLKFVARHEGAFGVLRADAAKAEGIKVLFEFTATP